MPKKQVKRQKKVIAVAKNCPFCKEGKNPDYMDVKTLQKYVTERGKILSAAKTGICSLHQRRVTTAVKHARHLALLPFMQRI